MTDSEKTPEVVPAPASWTSMSPKDRYAEQEAAEYDPYDHEAAANDLG